MSASRKRRRASASITHAARSTTPAVRRRKPIAASTNAPVSRSRVVDPSLPATNAKATLTKAKGISANSKSDKKIVQACSRHSAVAATARPGRRYTRAKASVR